jgi:hypothetical protein
MEKVSAGFYGAGRRDNLRSPLGGYNHAVVEGNALESLKRGT